MRLHFIGVGGSGMSAVARLAAAKGAHVTGSDRRRSAYFAALEAAGVDVRVGHEAGFVDGADVVVISTAVRESNPELAKARELGIPVWHRSVALAWALEGKRIVSVAGSHGKTTTSAMIAHGFHASGVDASYAVGARVFGVEGAVAGGYGGSAADAVVEADESDRSFLVYDTHTAVILNVEADHLDTYGSLDEVERAFVEFASKARLVIACADDPGALRVADAARDAGVKVVTYGTSAHADVSVDATSVTWGSVRVDLDVPVPGAHNRLNATAAWIALTDAGVDPAAAAKAMASFAGTGRRFELKGTVGATRVIDDYAHHPTEVAAVLAAARSIGAPRIVVLFQPALFTRTRDFHEQFAAALSLPDAHIVLAPVHGDREDPIDGVDSALIASGISPMPGSAVELAESLDDAARRSVAAACDGDWILTVGSGTVTEAGPLILQLLRERRADG